jgi:hypothetical protein
VRAVLDGWVERVRASGVGYGRAVYLRLADGRTAVYGHLSRFAPKLDAWVAARQDSAGVYEQDLMPAAGEIAFTRGRGRRLVRAERRGPAAPALRAAHRAT